MRAARLPTLALCALAASAGAARAQPAQTATRTATRAATPVVPPPPVVRPPPPVVRPPPPPVVRPPPPPPVVRPPPRRPEPPAPRNEAKALRDAGVAATATGAWAATPGWSFWDVVGPPAPAEAVSAEEEGVGETLSRLDAALWTAMAFVVGVFVALRIFAWVVRRGAQRGSRRLALLRRGWVFVEGTVWAALLIWGIGRLARGESATLAVVALLALVAVVALTWGGIRDVAAGLMVAAERPFGLGDEVALEDGKGRVRAFRARVLELERPDGERVRVPYRRVLGATHVRRAHRRTACPVTVRLEVPSYFDPREALAVARELALSSPWAVLGATPQVDWSDAGAEGASRVQVVGFAFAKDVEPLLRADVVAGWQEAVRARGPKGKPAA